MATMADAAMRQWLIRMLTGKPKCCCTEDVFGTSEPCAWLGTVTVTFYSQMGTFSVQTCHWHAGILARNENTVRRSDEALMAQRREEWFGGNT